MTAILSPQHAQSQSPAQQGQQAQQDKSSSQQDMPSTEHSLQEHKPESPTTTKTANSSAPTPASASTNSQSQSQSQSQHQSHLSASNVPANPAAAGTPIKRHPRPSLNNSNNSSSNRQSRLSLLSHRTSTRPASAIFPLYPSSLSYALVRDFAYPAFHPLHYGPLPPSPYSHRASTASSPYYDPHSDRRLSDPESMSGYSGAGWERDSRGIWSPGPWGGDGGAVYASPSADTDREKGGDCLPSTSFGFGYEDNDAGRDDGAVGRLSKNHRKSKSLAVGEEHGAAGTSGRRRSDRYSSSQPQQKKESKKDLGHLGTGLDSQGFFAAPDMGDEDDEEEEEEEETSAFHSNQHGHHRTGDESDFAGPSLALYTFLPENANELALREGQVIEVGYRHGQGWLVAMDLETGEQGLVPEEYVRLLRDIEGWGEEEEDFGQEVETEGDESGGKSSDVDTAAQREEKRA